MALCTYGTMVLLHFGEEHWYLPLLWICGPWALRAKSVDITETRVLGVAWNEQSLKGKKENRNDDIDMKDDSLTSRYGC